MKTKTSIPAHIYLEQFCWDKYHCNANLKWNNYCIDLINYDYLIKSIWFATHNAYLKKYSRIVKFYSIVPPLWKRWRNTLLLLSVYMFVLSVCLSYLCLSDRPFIFRLSACLSVTQLFFKECLIAMIAVAWNLKTLFSEVVEKVRGQSGLR